MKKNKIYGLTLCLLFSIGCNSENKKSTPANNSFGVDFFTIASKFIDKPYKVGTLDIDTINENLIVNIDSVDCTTFVEYVTASILSSKVPSIEDSLYLSSVQKIRYRDGIITDYTSRLHYFSSWIDNNQKRNIITEITDSFEYVTMDKTINFMSSNPQYYPQLRNNKGYIFEIKKEEDYINKLAIKYIPKDKVLEQVDKLKEGDIIAITTSIKSLDISHVGFIHLIDNTPHLLHASSDKKKVVVTKENISEYLKQNKSQTGIRVIRINAL